LFAIYPILFLFSHNIDEMSISEIFVPSIISLGVVTLLLLPGLFLKNLNKAGIIVAFFILMFFSYGHLYSSLQWRLGDLIVRHRYLLPTLWIIFISVLFLLIKTRRNLDKLTSFLNVIAISLIAISIINIGVYELGKNSRSQVSKSSKKGAINTKDLDNKSSTPDIYYIVLDSFVGENTLKESYSYDNSEFINSLKDKGFFVASNSFSNYKYTHQSLSATLNLKYINYLEGAGNPKDLSITYQMIMENEVTEFLKSRGYKYIHYDSGWGATQKNRLADKLVRGAKFSEFQATLLNTTMLRAISISLVGEKRRERILATFSQIPLDSRVEGPKFVFAHINSPHYPYIFGANGEQLEEIGPPVSNDRLITGEKYLSQLIFISKKVEELVEEILSNSKEPPIIILQADHGKNFTGSDSEDILNKEGYYKDGFSIFNALYLPSGGNDLLYDSISPVNTFRVVFNHYFGKDYELLKDRSFDSIFRPPYNFKDVTKSVNH